MESTIGTDNTSGAWYYFDYNVIPKKISEVANWIFSLFISSDPIKLTITSYNVGRIVDFRNISKLRSACQGIVPDNAIDIEIKFLKKEDDEKPKTNLTPQQLKENLEKIRQEKKTEEITRKRELREVIQSITDLGMSILCLQEAYDSDLEGNGSILPNNFDKANYGANCAVAWDKTKYELKDQNTIKNRDRYCIIVDLQDKLTGKIIRVSSLHLNGYDLKEAKNLQEKKISEQSLTEADVECEKKLVEVAKELEDIFKTLKTSPAPGFFERWFGQKSTPDIVVLGMDSNATPETSPLHFEKIKEHGFVRDVTDTRPTNVNPDLCQQVKLDYLLATSMENDKVEIKSKGPLLKKDQSEMKLWGLTNPSDHLPIIEEIIIN